MIHFVISNNAKFIPPNNQVFMIDGRIVDYNFLPFDRVWDHHCEGGRDCQMMEMPLPKNKELSILDYYKVRDTVTVTSPVYDADAIAAAVWLTLKTKYATKEVTEKLLAISLFCDHLIIPNKYQSLIKYSKFAAGNIAAIYGVRERFRQIYNFPEHDSSLSNKDQVKLDSEAFKYMVNWYTKSILYEEPWPNQLKIYQRKHWKNVNSLKKQIIENNLLSVISDVVVYDARSVKTRDPRAAYAAIGKLGLNNHLLFMTVWENAESGTVFTFWTNPSHPDWSKVHLTAFIKKFNLFTNTMSGARRTWGGTDYRVDIIQKISIIEAATMLSNYAQSLS
jgi:hypothetical protein